jgi:hypothetical protein
VSAFDPLAALAADAGSLTQSTLQALDLGVQIELLQQQLSVGDLISATILPPDAGVDRIQIFGQTVAASLPPGIDPGETLLLQVTGFSGNQILVRNLGTIDPSNPPALTNVELPPSDPEAPQQAILRTIPPDTAAPAPSTAPSAAPQAASTQPQPQPNLPAPAPSSGASAQTAAVSNAGAAAGRVPAPAAAAPQSPVQAAPPATVAPPREVFVAASVRPATPAPAGAPAVETPAAGRAAFSTVAAASESLDLEARIAASRTSDAAQQTVLPLRPGSAAPVSIAPRAASAPPPIRVAALPTTPRTPETEEGALLERARVPATPLALAAARVAGSAAASLPRVVARLDALLARVASSDPRAASLRNALSFATRLDPANARALPEQLASFVNGFIGGAESKFAALVRVLTNLGADPGAPELPEAPASASTQNQAPLPDAPAPATPSPQTPATFAQANAQPGAAPVPQAPPAAQTSSDPIAQLPPSAAAAAVERLAALQGDVKTAIAALVDNPPAGAPPELASALTETLSTITGLQLNALAAQNAAPQSISIALPVFYRDGGSPVQLRIDRDAPGGGALDPDNFHIAFVLDTASLGTVAIDLQTVGRTVSINVKTEGAPATDRFRSTLDDLRGRLTSLRYTVASIAADVAAHRRYAPAPAPEAAPEPQQRSSAFDRRA